ncbi:unnamed protein product [Ambrosiozyma monospora]|uniref:Unnamed protein product n=1 Tax=Ambrosiozyma monospora TaxID=43982 RepID=A0ACB5TCE9_AMBMO|nr:unnamed protein product [Ambrosiozyma monospora]
MQSLSSFQFGVTLRSLYSLQLRPGQMKSYHGSVLLFVKDSIERLPILFYHDSESPGFQKELKVRSRHFAPFADNQAKGSTTVLYWGGDRLISVLKLYCVLEPSSFELNVYLVNPTPEDRINFTPGLLQDRDHDGELTMKEIGENLNEIVNNAKWTVLSGLASITKIAKDTVNSTVNNVLHDQRVPQPVKKLLKKHEVQKIGDEFDSANIYLAKWALAVQEEAEKSRKVLIGNPYYNNLIKSELGDNFIQLTPYEVSKATRMKPLTKLEWDSYFDVAGCLQVTVDEVKDRIFHSGLEPEVRPEAWLFLLELGCGFG